VQTAERYDYLLTFLSGVHVDAKHAPSTFPVADGLQLANAFETLVPSTLRKDEVLRVFNQTSRPSVASARQRSEVDVEYIANTCQQLISALAR
jgi:hypothetical protein